MIVQNKIKTNTQWGSVIFGIAVFIVLSLWAPDQPRFHCFSDMLIHWQTRLTWRDLIGSRNHSPPMETPVRLLSELSKTRHQSEWRLSPVWQFLFVGGQFLKFDFLIKHYAMIRFLWRISTPRLNFYGVNSTLRWRSYGVSLGVYGPNMPIFGVIRSPESPWHVTFLKQELRIYSGYMSDWGRCWGYIRLGIHTRLGTKLGTHQTKHTW